MSLGSYGDFSTAQDKPYPKSGLKKCQKKCWVPTRRCPLFLPKVNWRQDLATARLLTANPNIFETQAFHFFKQSSKANLCGSWRSFPPHPCRWNILIVLGMGFITPRRRENDAPRRHGHWSLDGTVIHHLNFSGRWKSI